MTEEAVIPVQYTHSVKITDTAKGIRLDVHVWANSRTDAIIEALETYLDCQNLAKARGIQLAPIEIKENGAIEPTENKTISLTKFNKTMGRSTK